MKFGDTNVPGSYIWIGIAVILLFWVIGSYNGLVNSKVEVDQRIAQVQNVYQRRADLIPNLVEVVKGYASHEKGTLEGVIQARASATQIKLSPNTTPEDLKKWQAAQGELSQALGKLMMLKEAYPNLKANENFLALQKQVEGTENRIAQERRMWQLAVQQYNVKCQRFPSNIIAGMFGFKTAAFFEADEGAKVAPKIKFN
jgi:LemA protein